MHRLCKNELEHVYGPWVVASYTCEREKSNGCIIWKVKCKHCGHVRHYNGNNLRFNHFGRCPNCGRRD